ncbi:hypothetical protein L6R53_25785 [Myxococcota bacterium]|nr:hypothetical protein [Myxococcota bacterium]
MSTDDRPGPMFFEEAGLPSSCASQATWFHAPAHAPGGLPAMLLDPGDMAPDELLLWLLDAAPRHLVHITVRSDPGAAGIWLGIAGRGATRSRAHREVATSGATLAEALRAAGWPIRPAPPVPLPPAWGHVTLATELLRGVTRLVQTRLAMQRLAQAGRPLALRIALDLRQTLPDQVQQAAALYRRAAVLAQVHDGLSPTAEILADARRALDRSVQAKVSIRLFAERPPSPIGQGMLQAALSADLRAPAAWASHPTDIKSSTAALAGILALASATARPPHGPPSTRSEHTASLSPSKP